MKERERERETEGGKDEVIVKVEFNWKTWSSIYSETTA